MSILLYIHSGFALLTIVAVIATIAAAGFQFERERLVLGSLWSSLIGAVASGTILTMTVPVSLGRSCVLLASFALVALGAHVLYRKAVPSQRALEN